MNENTINEIYDEDGVKEINDFGKETKKKDAIGVIVLVAVFAALIAGALLILIKTDGETKKSAKSNEQVIDELYLVEEECLENADLIAGDMIEELTDIKEYLDVIDQSVKSNEETLSNYPDSKSYSQLSVTFKDSTQKISNDFSQVSSEIDKTRGSIDSLIKKLETSGDSKEITKEYESIRESIKTIDSEFSGSIDKVNKLIDELMKEQSKDNENLLKSLKEVRDDLGNKNSSEILQVKESIAKVEANYGELVSYLDGVLTKQFDDLNGSISDKMDAVSENVTISNEQIENTINERFDSFSLSFSTSDEGIKETLEKINENIEKVFYFVSDVKQVIASAIADKGIGTDKDATFKVLSESIALIGSDVINVSGENILQGTRVYDGIGNSYVEGSIVNRGSQSNFSPSEMTSITYEAGYYPSSWTVDTTGAYEKGYLDGKGDVPNARITYNYHVHTLSDGTVKEAGFRSEVSDGCFSKPVYHEHSGDSVNGGGCYTIPVYHVHTGSSEKGGGCYTVAHSGLKTAKCYGGAYCGQGPYPADTSGQEYYVGTCNVCGAHLSCYNSPGYVNCDATRTENYTYYTVGCGKDSSTVVGYKPSCNKEGTEECYECGCGKEDYATAGDDATIASATISYE